LKINGFNIYNTYKPSNVKWVENSLVKIVKPALVTGDFNSHNTTWGYDSSDEIGEALQDRISATFTYFRTLKAHILSGQLGGMQALTQI